MSRPFSTVSMWAAAALALAAAAYLEWSGWDLWLQDLAFNFQDGTWQVSSKDALGRMLFYTGPKALLILFACSLVVLLIGRRRWRKQLQDGGWLATRGRIIAVLFCAGSIPLAVAAMKATSGVFCPSELERYGGSAHYLRPYSVEVSSGPRGRCWPAGHASGGFALLSLLVAAASSKRRLQVWCLGMFAGWTMGFYQTLKGAHFVSHTLVTLSISLCSAAAFQVIAARFGSLEPREPAYDAPP